jgi:NADH dehydrogenase [ubiquinone] 1 alpha subcomplex assembly factor 1
METNPSADIYPLIDFAEGARDDWTVVDDDVMGGISSSTFTVTRTGVGIFKGNLSRENNGGFTSVRTALAPNRLRDCTGLRIRARGDGRTYEFRLRAKSQGGEVSFGATFPTRPDVLTWIELPFHRFEPAFRGKPLPDVPPLDPKGINRLGIMIKDGQAGRFRIEIERIDAVRRPRV